MFFDLSLDTRTNTLNNNVVYELGVANAIREPTDMVLIQRTNENKLNLPFDFGGLHVNPFEGDATQEFIERILRAALENQEWHKSKRVRVAAESIDGIGLHLIVSPKVTENQ